jgi:hypothetical protein
MSADDRELGILKKAADIMVRKAEDLIVRAVDDPALFYSLFSSPPEVSIIASILPAAQSEILSRRYNQLWTELKLEAALIDETKIDKSFFLSDYFYDLLVKVVRSTLETDNKNKIRLYARILLRPALLDNAKFRYYSKDFVSLLSELSPADLQLAREVYKRQKEIIPPGTQPGTDNEVKLVRESGFYELRKSLSLDDAQYGLAITKLSRAGLIRQVVGSYIEYTGDAYMITPVFRKMIELIQDPEYLR